MIFIQMLINKEIFVNQNLFPGSSAGFYMNREEVNNQTNIQGVLVLSSMVF